MEIRQEGKDFLEKKPISRVESKIGSRTVFYFLLYLIEEPKPTTASPNRDRSTQVPAWKRIGNITIGT